MLTRIWQEIKQSFQQGGTLVRLIYINLAVFLAYNILFAFFFLAGTRIDHTLTSFLAVPAHVPTLFSRPWTILTYMFFHQNFIHILFNLLWLYWMGRIFLEFLSPKKMLGVYIMGGIAGALLFILFYNIFPVFNQSLPLSRALGASAAVYAIVFAVVAHSPNLTLRLAFLGPVKLKFIGLALVFLDIMGIAGSNAGGHIAHLGGALFGLLFINSKKNGVDLTKPIDWFIDAFTTTSAEKKRKKMRVTHKVPRDDYEYNKQKADNQAEIDRILDKISQGGYDALTKEEKETLFRMKNR